MKVLTHFILLALCLHSARGVVTGLTLSQQITDTVIESIDCDAASGAFIVTFYNGFLTTQTYYLSGQCDGIQEPLAPTPASLTAPGRTNATGFLYGPASSSKTSLSIYGAQCTIRLAIAQSADNGFISTQVIRQSPAVCGPFQAGKCDCPGFWSISCYWNNCDPAESTFFWMIILGGATLLFGLVFLTLHAYSTNKKLELHNHYRAHVNRDRGTKLQKKVDEYSRNVRDGKMTKERIEVELRATNMQLNDPQYVDLRRMEYVNPSGKKYTGLDSDEVLTMDDSSSSVEMTTFKDHSGNNNYAPGHVDVYPRHNAGKISSMGRY